MSKRIAIIGGSGLDQLEGLELYESQQAETVWGSPSDAVQIGAFSGVDVLFLPRHGHEHLLPPHKINYRANIAALKQLGVDTIIACNAVGGIDPQLNNGDLVLMDQLIDYTWGREHSFYGDAPSEPLRHIDFSYPFSSELNKQLLLAAQASSISVIPKATVAVTQGPRLETAAEIKRFAQDGCGIVGMTTMPEAGLAREAGMDYAAIALVVNPAAGLSQELITEAAMRDVMAAGIQQIKVLLGAFLAQQCQ